jgi:hypothetical protein
MGEGDDDFDWEPHISQADRDEMPATSGDVQQVVSGLESVESRLVYIADLLGSIKALLVFIAIATVVSAAVLVWPLLD